MRRRNLSAHKAVNHKCRRCQARWPQWKGLCRRCWRELGDVRGMKDYEAERVANHQAQLAAKQRPADTGPRPDLEKTIGGVDYLVTWDGA